MQINPLILSLKFSWYQIASLFQLLIHTLYFSIRAAFFKFLFPSVTALYIIYRSFYFNY